MLHNTMLLFSTSLSGPSPPLHPLSSSLSLWGLCRLYAGAAAPGIHGNIRRGICSRIQRVARCYIRKPPI